jgi:peptidoglycan hydrolase CwlO-like protein
VLKNEEKQLNDLTQDIEDIRSKRLKMEKQNDESEQELQVK